MTNTKKFKRCIMTIDDVDILTSDELKRLGNIFQDEHPDF
ncbi:hypothetical protein [Escherichia phage pEC-M719-6WT.2]|nr:hypothetical protein [Escherichia phage pEC-M719-6WT.2]